MNKNTNNHKKEFDKKINSIIQFTVILMIGAIIVIGTAWAVNYFEKPVECICDCPKCKPVVWNCELCLEACGLEKPSECLKCPERRNLMEELYFWRAVDGAIGESEFVPFFCEIYNQCQNSISK